MAKAVHSCPQCHCPLTPAARSQSGMACPRCNFYVILDPLCTGGCLSCSKFSEHAGGGCAEPDVQPVAISRTPSGPPAQCGAAARACVNDEDSYWKRLLKGLFPVR